MTSLYSATVRSDGPEIMMFLDFPVLPWEYRIIMAITLDVQLALRVTTAFTLLTVYRWLQIPVKDPRPWRRRRIYLWKGDL